MNKHRVWLVTVFAALSLISSPTKGGDVGKPVRATGRDVLSLARAIAAGEVDTARAEKFLDAVLQGKVVWSASKSASSKGEIVCHYTECDSKTCAECDLEEETCWCSNCCIAAAAAESPKVAVTTSEPAVTRRQRQFSHTLGIGNPPAVFTVNPKGTVTLIEARGQNASAFLNCGEYRLTWGIPKVGENRLIERGCPNMELFANGLGAQSQPVSVTVRVDD